MTPSPGSTAQGDRERTLSKQSIDNLRSELRGRLLTPEHSEYDSARRIWNGMIDRRPALIARCSGAGDVRSCVRFAKAQGVPLSIRGGGHNIAGTSLCEGGLVIDLSPLRSVEIDPLTRRAHVQPGATLSDFDAEAQAFGLATPLGINSTTGVAGLTLGGGFGWLTRKYGLTIDNLVSADLVNAKGEFMHVNQEENPELFWALRGGGGNFGVVTRFEFQVHPVGPEVLSGLIVYPMDQAKAALQQYRELVAKMPDDLSVWLVLRDAPPLPFLPASVHGKPVLVLAVFYAGKDTSEGQRLIEPFRRLGSPHGEHVGLQPYRAWQQAFDPLLTPGARNYWKSHNLNAMSDSAIDVALDHAKRLPSPHCEVFFALLGGQASRIDRAATAYPHRDALFAMNVHARWETPAEDRACIDWARSLFRTMAPHAAGGVYVNFLTEDESERIRDAYGPNYERLASLKERLDPDNLFRANMNIKPRG
jgi:FAD/FMN-containing dehydrogenase